MPKICPGCQGELDVVPASAGMFVCVGCLGRFLQKTALTNAGVQIPQHLARRLPRRPRKCAGCASNMDNIVVQGVTLDHCLDCGGLYFDNGELEALRKSGKKGAEPPPDDREIECDGCSKPTPIAELTSLDGKALCEACIADDPHFDTQLSNRDFGQAQRDAAYDRVEGVTGGRHQDYGFDDDRDTAENALLDGLLRFF